MAKKNKFYAVKVGRSIGVFDNWKECSDSTQGFSGSLFQAFKSYEEAEIYLNTEIEKKEIPSEKAKKIEILEFLTGQDEVNVFTDGSYNDELNYCSYGYIMFSNENDLKLNSAAMRDKYDSNNISGEIEGVKAAIDAAIYYNKKRVKIFHDLQGIKFWADGSWKRNKESTIKYKEFIDSRKEKIEILFQHVKGHSGNVYNEMADSLAGNEIKSLIPDTESEWGYKSYKYNDEKLIALLNKIKLNFPDFYYAKENKGTHNVIKCGLHKESITIVKYTFQHGNKLLIKKIEDSHLFSLVISYLNDIGKIESLIQTFNANYNTNFTNIEVQTKLYEISPVLKGKVLDKHIYRLLLSSTYEIMRDIHFIEDASYIIVPAMRALEGHLKMLFDKYLGLQVVNGIFGFFQDDSIGGKELQTAHKNKISNDIATHIEKCYNYYCNVRHVYFHFGDINMKDTKFMNAQESKDKIIETIELIGEYY